MTRENKNHEESLGVDKKTPVSYVRSSLPNIEITIYYQRYFRNFIIFVINHAIVCIVTMFPSSIDSSIPRIVDELFHKRPVTSMYSFSNFTVFGKFPKLFSAANKILVKFVHDRNTNTLVYQYTQSFRQCSIDLVRESFVCLLKENNNNFLDNGGQRK